MRTGRPTGQIDLRPIVPKRDPSKDIPASARTAGQRVVVETGLCEVPSGEFVTMEKGMRTVEKDLMMKLRQHLKILRHEQGRIRLGYKIGAIGVLRQIQSQSEPRLLDAIEGVHKVSVSPLTFTLTIHYDPEIIQPSWWETIIQESDAAARKVLDRVRLA